MKYGYKRGKPLAAPAFSADVSLPPSADVSALMPPVNDQSALGSCVANSLCETLEYLERQGQADTLFSRLYLYYYGRAKEGVQPTDDSGMFIGDAVAVLQERGVCLESSWPYVIGSYSQQPPAACDAEAAQRKVVLAFGLPNLFCVKACLAQGFPCAFGMEVYSSLENTTTGDVEMPQPGEVSSGGHAVVAVAYSDETQRITFQNSWGASWGRGGLGTIPYAMVTRGIAADFVSLRRATL